MDDILKRRLKDDLASDLRDQIPRSDILTVQRLAQGGRRRRLFMATAIGVCVAGISLGGTFALLRLSPPRVASPPSAAHQGETVKEMAAAVALNALIDADLLNPSRTALDYQGIRTTRRGWTATFQAYDCSGSETSGACHEQPGQILTLDISRTDQTISIVGVGGSLAPTPSTLNGFEQDLSTIAGSSGWSMPAPVARSGTIEAVPIWNGPIPSPGIGSTCRPKIVDENDKVIWEGKPAELAAPSSEAGRDGGIQIFGGAPSPKPNEEPRIDCSN